VLHALGFTQQKPQRRCEHAFAPITTSFQ
jgi:hypothetical protein